MTGAHVIAAARSQKALEELDDAIRADGGAATLVPMDLKDLDGIDRLGAALFERFGRLDGLAACAGVLGPVTPTSQVSPGSMMEVLNVNLVANQRLIRSMHPLLRAAPAGRAVFLTSGLAARPRAYFGAYAASKAGLEALVRCYADELEITPIKANLYNPGRTRTAMRAKAFPGENPETLPPPEAHAEPIAALLRPDCTANGQLFGPPDAGFDGRAAGA
jgi:NAD(P)-dependent dehydrogenase (short-subunit alcohol dehydrogenase family)